MWPLPGDLPVQTELGAQGRPLPPALAHTWCSQPEEPFLIKNTVTVPLPDFPAELPEGWHRLEILIKPGRKQRGGGIPPRPSQRCSAGRGWASASSGSVLFSAPEGGGGARQAGPDLGPQGTHGNSCGLGPLGVALTCPPQSPLCCIACSLHPVRSLETGGSGQGREADRGQRGSEQPPLPPSPGLREDGGSFPESPCRPPGGQP